MGNDPNRGENSAAAGGAAGSNPPAYRIRVDGEPKGDERIDSVEIRRGLRGGVCLSGSGPSAYPESNESSLSTKPA